MSRLLLFLAACILCLSLPSMAQTGKDKKEPSLQDKILGSWKVDSIAIVKKGARQVRKPEAPETMASHCFLPNNKVIFLEKLSVDISNYDILESSNVKFLKVEDQMGLPAHIEELSGNILALKYTLGDVEKNPAKQGGEVWMYFSRAPFPFDTLKARLAGTYKIVSSRGAKQEKKNPYSIRLGRDGQMGSYLNHVKDTGTWTIDPVSFNLRLNGKRSGHVFELRSWNRANKITLYVDGTKDSLIRLERVPEMASVNEREEKFNGPVAEMPDISSAEWSRDQKKLTGVWKAVKVFRKTDQGIVRDTQNRVIRLSLQHDGNLSFFEGDNVEVGEWKKAPGKAALLLDIKGQEVLATYKIFAKNPGRGKNDSDSDSQLMISFLSLDTEVYNMFFFEKEE